MVHRAAARFTETMNETLAPSTRPAASALRAPLLMAATVATGWMAGMFFAFSYSVMPGLARVDDRTFVVAMQHINDATNESAIFGLTFSVAAILVGAAAVVHHRLGLRTATWWILAALALYLVAVGITAAVHIPLNEALDAAETPGQAARAAFEVPWNSAHLARTISGALALACLSLAGSSGAHR